MVSDKKLLFLKNIYSTFSKWLVQLRCQKDRHRRTFLTTAIRFDNKSLLARSSSNWITSIHLAPLSLHIHTAHFFHFHRLNYFNFLKLNMSCSAILLDFYILCISSYLIIIFNVSSVILLALNAVSESNLASIALVVIISWSVRLSYTGRSLVMHAALLFTTVWCSISAKVSLPDSELICIKAPRSGVEGESMAFCAQQRLEKVVGERWGIGPIPTLWLSLYSMCAFCHHAPAASFISVTHRMPWLR